MDVTSLFTFVKYTKRGRNKHSVQHLQSIPEEQTSHFCTTTAKSTQTYLSGELSFQLNGENYLQIHGIAMGTKMGVAFTNIFMTKVETEILNQSASKLLVWERFIDDTSPSGSQPEKRLHSSV